MVIPAFAETESLPQALEKLAAALTSASPTLVLIVVNNPPASAKLTEGIADNQDLLEKLKSQDFNLPEPGFLAWIDASSAGFEIPANQGVGGARKLGMDTALHYFQWDQNPIIFSLDADTLVADNYLSATSDFFQKHPEKSGLSLKFKHQPGKTPEEERAIRLYEEFMNRYVEGLQNSPTPYAYHSIGSAMVFRAEAYIKAGGMRPRPAGEDFYFLQALCKCGTPPQPIGDFTGTWVSPSARLSDRVPFGTGPKMQEYIQKIQIDENPAIFYNPQIFDLLKEILEGVDNGQLEKSVQDWFNSLPSPAKDFMESCEFRKNWEKILRNTPNKPEKIKWAFHTWFDAFRILKFIHFCEKEPYNYPRVCE